MIFLQLYNFIERKLAANAAYSRALNELQLFSERDLFDIHMSSADIPRVAAQAAAEVDEQMRRQSAEKFAKARRLAA